MYYNDIIFQISDRIQVPIRTNSLAQRPR